jgi:hypothetical protein
MKRRVLLSLLLLVSGAGAARALAPGDGVVVVYKDGAKVSGILVARTNSLLTVDMGGARLTSNVSDVRSVVARRTAVQRFEELLKAAEDDRVKLRAAADFAREHELHTYYSSLAERLGLPRDAVESPAPPALLAANPFPAAGAATAPSQLPPSDPVDPAVPDAASRPLGFTDDNPLALVPAEVFDFDAPRRERGRDDAPEFLKRQAAERDERRHEVTSPLSDWQFSLQQALDRQARGLPFRAP